MIHYIIKDRPHLPLHHSGRIFIANAVIAEVIGVKIFHEETFGSKSRLHLIRAIGFVI
jgi:hypothetical protein